MEYYEQEVKNTLQDVVANGDETKQQVIDVILCELVMFQTVGGEA